MCSKHDGRRSSRHAPYYASLPPKVAARKDRNVRRSTRGKFESVKELLAAHPCKPSRIIPRERIIVVNNWLSHDGPGEQFTAINYERRTTKVHYAGDTLCGLRG